MKKQKYKKLCSKNKFKPKKKIIFISLDNPRVLQEVEKQSYQNYLNNQCSNETEHKEVKAHNLENIFTSKIYYQAMKDLPLIEKKIIYFDVIENEGLEEICKILNLTKNEVLNYQNKAKRHFKRNVKKYLRKGGK